LSRQKLGQHFLVSTKALERISRAACGERVELAVEIGPGRGALTEHLLQHADRVAAIELDPSLVAYLRERWAGEPRFDVLEANALDTIWADYGPGVLAGNLPYYVATHLIANFLRAPGQLRQAVFLIQKEVAARITAKPGSRDYGYFSVECQLLCETAEYLFAVPPGAFRPPPEVDSAVVRLVPRPQPAVADVSGFLRFASAAFRHKRKTLRNNLAGQYPYEAVPSDQLSCRAEQLGLSDLIRIYELTGVPCAPDRV
jgi:16S rRNA (adenine1518-N6/adenine1519-N6)-dimethyltransferase